jgi:DNA-directed RNA polymerase subunit RPC12/RpoP
MSEELTDATERPEASSVLFDRWMGKASENIEKLGLQSEETLLLAIQEELGELTQAHLEACDEGGDPTRVDAELDDLGALLIQLHEARNTSRFVCASCREPFTSTDSAETEGGSVRCPLCSAANIEETDAEQSSTATEQEADR